MKNRISTGALFAMLMLMAMLPRTGHSQEIDPNAYYEIVSSNNLVLDNQDSEDDGTQIFINNRVENRVSQVWQLTTPGYGVYKICTPLSDKCVDNNNTKEPGPVIQWDNGATNMNQFWKLTKIGGNTYTFTNITNGLNLGISDDGQPGKAALQLVADSTSARQHWTLRRSNIKIDKEALRSSSDKDWENETIFAINKEPGHTTYVPFPSVESLKSSPDYRKAWLRPNSPRYQLLNGNWKFNWVNSRPNVRSISINRTTMFPAGKKFRFLPIGKCTDTVLLFIQTSRIRIATTLLSYKARKDTRLWTNPTRSAPTAATSIFRTTGKEVKSLSISTESTVQCTSG